ncbi:MAG TPA: TonB-dependent receptor [Terriglobales bacterium]|nr:TonB-dependent receptor [Terriglobales bacterium]
MNFLKSLTLAFTCLFLAATMAWAQGVGSSGNIQGTVTDPSNAVLPGATVTAVATQTGLQRATKTDSNGFFNLTGLPPATYDVTVELSGFSPQVQKGVIVSIGQTAMANYQLKVGQVATEVVVTGEAPVIDTTEGKQANTIGDRLITDLPIDRRDYLTFTLLLPGVSNSTVIADNADFRVKQTPQSGLSFYGSNGRGNNVTVDGGETNDDAGGVRLNVSQDAVQEFQINRSNYAAELGSASGASINIVTKSGTNKVHGGAFGFFRNDAMDARDPFAFSPALTVGQPFSLTGQGQPIKNSLSRQQFGATLGFPIQKDKTFMFLSYEGLRSDAQDSVPLLTTSSIFGPTAQQLPILGGLVGLGGAPVPCLAEPAPAPPGTFLTLPAQICAGALQSILTVNPTPGPNPFVSPGQAASNAFIVNQFETNGGLFPFPTREHEGSLRLDHQFNQNNQAFLRYSAAHLDEQDPDVHALTGISRGNSILNWDSNLEGAYYHQFSPFTQNELRLQWDLNQFNVTTNDQGGPGLDVQGFGFFGRGIFLPSFTRTRRYEFADNVTLVRGRHTMKTGFYELLRGNKTTSDTFFAGRFEFLQLPGGLLSPCLQIPALCGLPLTTPSAPISNLQAWSLGLPAFYEQGFGDPTYSENRPLTAAYWQDSWQMRSNFTLNYGLRYEVDSQYGPLNTDKNNFAPRVSFAWDPFGQHKTVVRGGYGIFYSPVYAQISNVVKTLGNVNGTRQIANTLVSILGVPGAPALNSAAIYQTLFAEGKILCGTPPAGANACITPADLQQFGLTVANTGPLPPGTVLFAGQPDYQNPSSQQASLGVEQEIGEGFTVSANYIYVHTQHLPWAVDTNLLPGAPVVTGTGADGLPTNGLPFQNWGAPQCQADPALCFADPTHTILQNNVYSSIASAVYNGGILEMRKRFSNHLTLIGNYTYSKAIDDATDFNSDYAAFNEVNLRAERALSDFDERHKIVFAGVLSSPFENSRVFSGFELSPIISYNSGHPFNLLAGSDINGDGHFTNDRPPGAGRNSGRGPDYVTFDMRLGRAFKLGEKASLLFTAEGFNITNTTNFASVNNIVGATFAPPFNVQGTAGVSPSQPLGFTSAFPKREIQLGLRLSF